MPYTIHHLMPASARNAKSKNGRFAKLLTPAKSFFNRSSRSTSPQPNDGTVGSLPPSPAPNPTPATPRLVGSSSAAHLLPVASSQTITSPSPSASPPSAQPLSSPSDDVDVYQKLLPRTLTDAKISQTAPPKRKLTGLSSAGWNALKQTLRVTQDFSDGIFQPLNAAVTGLLVIMNHIEKVDDVQTDFAGIASRIDALNSLLGQYQRTESELPLSVRIRLDKFSGAINLQNEAIEDKIGRGLFKRTIEATADSGEIVRVLQTLSSVIDVFAIDTALNTDINVEKIRTQLDTLVQESEGREQYVNVNINDSLSPVNSALCDPEGYPEEYKCCLPGTREDALYNAIHDLKKALKSGENQRFWLTGVAGSGKSTLSTTIVSTLRREGVTVATFFCKRDQVNRRNPRLVIPTLAWYLATKFPEFRKSLGPVLAESLAGRKALPSHPAGQLETLLLNPLQHLSSLPTPSPIVILIDALDESDEASRHLLVDALVKDTVTFPPQVSVVLVSRKSRDLQRKLQSLHVLLDLDRHLHDPSANHDIRLYLEDRLQEIREEQEEEPNWPSEFEVSSLTKRADGLFIWAVIACNFIEQPSCRDELSRLLQTNVAVGIDDLYAHTLGSEFSKMRGKTAWFEDYRSVMGCIICSLSPLAPEDIALLIGRSLNVVNATLNILQPLLYRDEKSHVRLVHASLADYLLAKDRSQQLWVAHPYLHLSLARGCLNALIECSSRSSLDLTKLASPATFVHLSVDNLATHVRYSSTSWAEHLVQAHLDDSETSKIAEIVEIFLTDSFLSWLEILSLLDNVSDGVHALTLLCSWAKDRGTDIENLAIDFLRFLETFRVPIQRSTAHIYISALPWAPSNSQIASIYRNQLDPQRCNLPLVCSGLPSDWASSDVFESMELKLSEIEDPIFISTDSRVPEYLVFSPDGSLVAQALGKELRVWETLNGTLVFGPLHHTSKILSVGISPNNKFIASAIEVDSQLLTEASPDSLPKDFLEIAVFPITAPTASHIFRRNIEHPIPKFNSMLLAFSIEDSPQLRAIPALEIGIDASTWNIETGSPVEGSKHTFPSLSSAAMTNKVVFEHATGWLLRRDQVGPSASGPYCFIPWYSWDVQKLKLFRNHCTSAFHPSGIAVLILGDDPIILRFPKEWKTRNPEIWEAYEADSLVSDVEIMQNPIESSSVPSPPVSPVNDISSEQVNGTASESQSLPISPSTLSMEDAPLSPLANILPSYFFDTSEASTTARYQYVLKYMRYAELSENFLTQSGVHMVHGSTVQFFCEDPVSLPFVHVRVGSLPPARTMWVRQQDKGGSGEQLKFKFTPCHDPNEAYGTVHFLVHGQRGFWPIYVVFDSNPESYAGLSSSESDDYPPHSRWGMNRSRTSLSSTISSRSSALERMSSSPGEPWAQHSEIASFSTSEPERDPESILSTM